MTNVEQAANIQVHQQRLESYLEKVQSLILRAEDHPSHMDFLFELIQQEKDSAQDNASFKAFYEGEEAFYKGEYSQSLTLYKQATEVPHFAFFCCRSTAFILQKNKRYHEAITFIQKAIKISPQDAASLKLLTDLFVKIENVDDALKTRKKLEAIRSSLPLEDVEKPLDKTTSTEHHPVFEEKELSPQVSLGNAEVDELAKMFVSTSAQKASPAEASPQISSPSQQQKEESSSIDLFDEDIDALLSDEEEEENEDWMEENFDDDWLLSEEKDDEEFDSLLNDLDLAEFTEEEEEEELSLSEPTWEKQSPLSFTSDEGPLSQAGEYPFSSTMTSSIPLQETPEEEASLSVLLSKREAPFQHPLPPSSQKATFTAAIQPLMESIERSSSEAMQRPSSQMLKEDLGLDVISQQSLESRITAFKKRHAKLISQYVEKANSRTRFEDFFLTVLNGWDYSKASATTANHELRSSFMDYFLMESQKKTSGGIYFRWNQKGIVINPGQQFLDSFHAEGYHIKDIDYVIVTRCEAENYSNIRDIYALNYQYNTISKNLHVIHYYLNQKAFQDISTSLKPHFKQERNSVHSLDLYVDSPEIESIILEDSITLRYFHNASGEQGKESLNIGVRFELHALNENTGKKETLSLAYLSGMPWSPLLTNHLHGCDCIVAGFEKTSREDYNLIRYNNESLGFYGLSSLLEEVSPRLLLCCEFDGEDGDIRLEAVKKLRQSHGSRRGAGSIILPGDTGMQIDLKRLRVKCSVTDAFVLPNEIHATKPCDAFGKLQYLSPACFL